MSIIKTILVPTDFSAAADSAVHYAKNVAEQFNAAIVLYHSFIPFASGFYPQELSKKENYEMAETLRKRLNLIREELLKQNGSLEVSVQVDQGPENVTLLDYCQANPVDIIIMGTIGASGLKEVVIGSFAADTMTSAPCPVLAIPENYPFKIPQKITYATSYRKRDPQVLTYLAGWSQQLSAQLSVLHIDEKDLSEEAQEAKFQEYKAAMENEGVNLQVNFQHLAGDDIPETILKVASQDSTDILAVSPIKRTGIWDRMFHKSVTKSTAYHMHLPLLTVPVKSNFWG